MESIDIVGLVLGPCVFGSGAFIVSSIGTNIRRARVSKAMVEMQTRMIEKLPPEELAGYANSEAGRAILTLDAGRAGSPRDRILNALTAGFVTLFLGLALVLARRVPSASDVREAFHAVGTVGMAIGLGLLVSAAVSYKLSQSWGLFEDKK